jgi:GT2 family glycosyltransferase
MNNKIGVGVITCNRPEYLRGLIDSLEQCNTEIDEFVVINDGEHIDKINLFKGELLQNPTNEGVAKSKNRALTYLLNKNCEYLFLIEDDMVVKNKNVFQKYIQASKASKILHFNYGPGSPFNRVQTIANPDLHNRHMLKEDSKPNPRIIVDYGNDCKIALYQHTVAMFSFFTNSLIKEVGFIPEIYPNCWEHVDHTYRIIKAGHHPPFWWFADIADSCEYLTEAPQAIQNSAIAKDKNDWQQRVMKGGEIYKIKHGHYPNQPPKLYSQLEVTQWLKDKKNQK